MKNLEREVKEVRWGKEILKLASAFPTLAELYRRLKRVLQRRLNTTQECRADTRLLAR